MILAGISLLSVPAATAQALKVTQLNVPDSTATYAADVNAKGIVVGLYVTSTGAQEGFEWTGSTYKTITVHGSNNFTRALGINDSNEIVADFLSTPGRLLSWPH